VVSSSRALRSPARVTSSRAAADTIIRSAKLF
jgi:hypothetical protein